LTRFQRIKEELSTRQLSFLYLVVVSFLIYILFDDWGYDDPFITYRYAKNIAAGVGFTYNIGEKVLSTSSPLFTLLLTLLKPIGIATEQMSVIVGSLSLTLGGLSIRKLGVLWGKPGIEWAGILIYPFFPLLMQTLGSETPLFLLLCIAAFYFYFREQLPIAFALAAFAFLTRPEGALVIAILIATEFLSHRRIPAFPIMLTVLIITPWLLFATSYFGSPVPATLAAKQHQGSLSISAKFLPRMVTILNWGYIQRWNYWIGLLLAMIGLLSLRRRDLSIISFLLWPASHLISLSLLGVSGYFWYYAPLILGFLLMAGNGFDYLFKRLRNRLADNQSGLRLAVVVVALSIFAPMIFHVAKINQNPDERLKIYEAIGQWINRNTDQDVSIGALEVGIIGYYGNRRMIDFSGVIQPAVATQLTPSSSYLDSAKWSINEFLPDYLVLSRAWASRLMNDHVIFACQEVQEFEGDDFGFGTNLSVYKCNWPTSPA
jgi:hypothetical protein